MKELSMTIALKDGSKHYVNARTFKEAINKCLKEDQNTNEVSKISLGYREDLYFSYGSWKLNRKLSNNEVRALSEEDKELISLIRLLHDFIQDIRKVNHLTKMILSETSDLILSECKVTRDIYERFTKADLRSNLRAWNRGQLDWFTVLFFSYFIDLVFTLCEADLSYEDNEFRERSKELQNKFERLPTMRKELRSGESSVDVYSSFFVQCPLDLGIRTGRNLGVSSQN